MSEHCCPNCFGDRGLKKGIIPSRSDTIGRCDFCGADDVFVVEPGQLGDVFGLLASIYQPASNGRTLVEWLISDWELFPQLRTNVARTETLITQIFDDGDIARERFNPSATYKSEGLARWETLRDELRYENRYFPTQVLDGERLRGLLDHLLADDLPECWFRARIMDSNQPYEISDMGAPPPQSALHGRANPTGIPYLYLGSSIGTAIAEVRPHTGEMVCIGDFSIPPILPVADLRNPRSLVSPFVLEDASEVGQLRADIPLLERLGDELTRPVLPRSAAIDYVPSQYLCEFIKQSGFDGVIYRSSVNDGMNLALFNPKTATGGNVQSHRVTSVTVSFEAVDSA